MGLNLDHEQNHIAVWPPSLEPRRPGLAGVVSAKAAMPQARKLPFPQAQRPVADGLAEPHQRLGNFDLTRM